MSSKKISKLVAVTALCMTMAGPLTQRTALAAKLGKNYFPYALVIDQDGHKHRFYDDLVHGKTVVINFMYTHCTDVCPLMTARLVQVQKKLGKSVGRDVFMYSISLDPKNDTPEAMKKHAKAFHVGPGWMFLTGDPAEIGRLRFKLGERSRKLSEHRTDIVLGNDRTGEWRRDSSMADTDRLVMNIRDLDPKLLAQDHRLLGRSFNDNIRVELDGTPGKALFMKACSSCHTIGRGVLVGPDLAGVAQRRDRDWLTRFMMQPEVLRARKDPIATMLRSRFEPAKMPNLGLSETDVGDLLTYLKAQEALRSN